MGTEKIIEILHNGNYSRVVENFDKIYTFSRHGVADLYDMVINKPGFLNGAFVADKVVCKAAAALIILGKADAVYAEVISLSALILMREAGIRTDFGRVVPFIRSRDKSRWCPLERVCYKETSAEAVLPIVEKFIENRRCILSSEKTTVNYTDNSIY